MIKRRKLYTYYTISVRFDNVKEKDFIKAFYHTKNKSAFTKECIKKELVFPIAKQEH